jgi:hypothetical protein
MKLPKLINGKIGITLIMVIGLFIVVSYSHLSKQVQDDHSCTCVAVGPDGCVQYYCFDSPPIFNPPIGEKNVSCTPTFTWKSYGGWYRSLKSWNQNWPIYNYFYVDSKVVTYGVDLSTGKCAKFHYEDRNNPSVPFMYATTSNSYWSTWDEKTAKEIGTINETLGLEPLSPNTDYCLNIVATYYVHKGVIGWDFGTPTPEELEEASRIIETTPIDLSYMPTEFTTGDCNDIISSTPTKTPPTVGITSYFWLGLLFILMVRKK